MPGVVDRPYDLDQQLKLQFGGNYWENWYGLGEKWIQGDAGWYWITPDGSLYKDEGTLENSTLVEVLGPIYHQDPTLLHDAQPPTPPISLVINGNQLTMTPELTSVGVFDVVVTASDGFHQTSQTFAVDVVNTAPDLDPLPDQQIPPGNSRSITLSATDPEGQSITYLASIEEVDNQAFRLDQALSLSAEGTAWKNWYGLGEKWIQGASGWYWITPAGAIFEDKGNVAASVLIDTLDSSYYDQPALLYDAQPSGTLSLDGSELTIGTNANFQGTFNVVVTASDGILTDSSTFVVQVINQAPILRPIPDQQLASGASITVPLVVSDPENDALTIFAETLTANSLGFELDQTLNLQSVGDLWNNWYGLGEKWVQGDAGWYWIDPDGSFYKDGGSQTSSTLVAELDPSYHDDLSLLYDAQPTLPPATLTLIGNQLTIDLAPSQSGTIDIRVTVADAFNEVSQTFTVVVIDTMPTLDGIAGQEIASGSSQSVALSASDLEDDPLVFSARIEGLEDSVYELDQQLGLRFSGSYWQNYYGLGEKWILGDDGYYLILPDGSLYKDGGSAAASTLVTVLDPIYHENPSLLHDAQPLANVNIDGNQLTVITSPGFVGTFQVVVSVSDGVHVADQAFTVNVSS